MDPIMILYALGQFVPSLLRWAGKDNAAEVAERVVKAADVATGKGRIEDQIEALKANPELLLQFQRSANELVIAQLEAETRQLEAVNATMRAEYASDDPYTKRWRPTMGYAVTFAWVLQMSGIAILIVAKPAEAATVIQALAQLTALWSVALAILGISVVKRSEDKQVASGFEPPGIIGAIAKTFGRK